MKRVVSLLLVGCSAFCLTACGHTDSSSAMESSSAPSSDVQVEATPDITPSSDSLDTSELPHDNPDVSNAVEENTIDTPLPLGEWGKVTMFSPTGVLGNSDKRGEYCTVYARVTGLVRCSVEPDKFQTLVDEHNKYTEKEAEKILPEEIRDYSTSETAIVTYDIFVPEDFKLPASGWLRPELDFDGKCPADVDENVAHALELTTGLMRQMATESSNESVTHTVGRIYHLAGRFDVTKYFDSFVLRCAYAPAGSSEFKKENMRELFFAIK